MKIGILTLPLHTNYGGILQAYALQTVLERMGHEVCLIEKRMFVLPLWKMPLVYGKRILLNLTGHPFPVFYEQKRRKEEVVIRQNTNKFIDKYIKRRIVEEFSEIREGDYDAIVVGSDQIWRPKYFHCIEHAYLDFAKKWNMKRISYAASFGTDQWEYTRKQTRRCGELLKYFEAVSVREASGVDLCRNYFGVEAKHVLDPTMLLTKEDYIRLFEDTKTPESKGTLLNYILDETPEKATLIDKVAKEMHLVPFRVNSRAEDPAAPLSERIQPSVEQWLRGFYDAEFVVTDSFHACVFSILFNKPFVAIGNSDRGMSRFTSLLSMFGLKNALLSKVNASHIHIDYDVVNEKLNRMREKSMYFLNENIK